MASEFADVAGIPDPEGEFFARITFGRQPTGDETQEKVYLHFEYPNLPYGGMVGIQKLLAEGALQDLVAMGEMVSETMDQPVLSSEEIKTELATLKDKRNKGKAPAKPANRR